MAVKRFFKGGKGWSKQLGCTVVLSALTAVLVSSACGTDDAQLPANAQNGVNSQEEAMMLLDVTPTPDPNASGIDVLKQVTFGDDTSSTSKGTATPAGLPTQGATVDKIELQFNVKILDNSLPPQFNYDPKSWIVCAGEGGNTYPFTGAEIEIENGGDDTLNQKVLERHGSVRLLIKPSSPKMPDTLYSPLSTSPSGRKAIKLQPAYVTDGKCPATAGSNAPTGLVSPIYLQTDVGALSYPASVNEVAVSEGSFTVNFAAPSDLSAVDIDSGVVKPAGSSTVSSYVVVYWKDSDCNAGGWNFTPNPTFDKNKSSLTCNYPGLSAMGANKCSFGCSGQVDGFYGKTADEVAIPVNIPSGENFENRTTSGCYTAVRVSASRSSLGVGDLKNGEKYGVAVFVLDSASHVGLGHSNCKTVVPQEIPIASTEKTPGLKKTKSDCFVVTAASGSVTSPAVHYWRLLRDRYLDRTGFVKWYMVHGPNMAAWLDAHPTFKPALNATFAFSGKLLVETDVAVHKAIRKMSEVWERLSAKLSVQFHQAVQVFQVLLVSEARADENTSAQSSESSSISTQKSSSGTVQSSSQNSSQNQSASSDNEGEGKPGSGSSALYFLFGATKPLQDKDLYDKYYHKRYPLSIVMGQTFRLLDAEGELGVGAELSYIGTSGRVPNTAGAEVQNRKIGFYSLGIAAVADYRLRIGTAPWLSPRLNVGLGVERFREEADTSQSATQASASTSNVTLGVTSWNPHVHVRASLEISLPKLSEDAGLSKFGYGLEDFLFSFYVGCGRSFGKTLSTGGLHFGGGLVFLLL